MATTKTKTKVEVLTVPFRLVVRGKNKDGLRVRRCKVVHCESYEGAWETFADHYEAMVKGLDDPAYSVLPPVGLKLNGTASKGFELATA